MAKQVSIEELRTNLAQLVSEAEFGREPITITKYRRKAAVLIGLGEYQRLTAIKKVRGKYKDALTPSTKFAAMKKSGG